MWLFFVTCWIPQHLLTLFSGDTWPEEDLRDLREAAPRKHAVKPLMNFCPLNRTTSLSRRFVLALMDAGGGAAVPARAKTRMLGWAKLSSWSHKLSLQHFHPCTDCLFQGFLHMAALSIWISRGSEKLANPRFASNIFVWPASLCKGDGVASLAQGMFHAFCLCRHCPKQLVPLSTAAQLGWATLHRYIISAILVLVHRKLGTYRLCICQEERVVPLCAWTLLLWAKVVEQDREVGKQLCLLWVAVSDSVSLFPSQASSSERQPRHLRHLPHPPVSSPRRAWRVALQPPTPLRGTPHGALPPLCAQQPHALRHLCCQGPQSRRR